MSWLFYVLIASVALELIVVFLDFTFTEYKSDIGNASSVAGLGLVLVCFVCIMIRSVTVSSVDAEHNWYSDMSFVNKNTNVPVRYEVVQESMMFSRKMKFVLYPNESKYLSRCTAGGYQLINECTLNSVESEYDRLTKGSN